MSLSAGFHPIVNALRNPNYGIYTLGSGVSLIGTWMQRIAVGWLTWQMTESGTWLGLIAFANLFPTVLIAPVAGVVADRWNRLTVIKISQSLALLQALMLFALTVSDLMTPGLLLGLTLWLGMVAAFNQPARLALIPSLVRDEDVAAAVAINAVIFNCARFIGPAAAGLIIVAGGIPAAFAVNTLSFAVFLYALSRIRLAPEIRPDTATRGLFGDIHDGLRYVAGHPAIGTLLALLTVSSLCVRPFIELLPGIAAVIYDGGAGTLALLTATVGIGAVVGGLWLARRARQRGLTAVALTAALTTAIALLAFVTTDRTWIAVPALMVAGFSMVANGVATQTLLQLRVDPAMRGRTLSLFGLVFRGGPGLGALAIGALSEWIGLSAALVAGAVLAVAASLWAWSRFGRLRRALEPGP
jgi:predicted MFS family arabinose efflux permease